MKDLIRLVLRFEGQLEVLMHPKEKENDYIEDNMSS